MNATRIAALLVTAVLVAGCGGHDNIATNAATSTSPKPAPSTPSASRGATPTAKPTREPAPSTPKLDSIVALGHSGTTGYASNPSYPDADARGNSWATGDNPAVDSVYLRLLATHPALKGHATSLGIDGSNVDSLPGQVTKMLELDPLPDVVIIQSIDNDMQCDGTDAANEPVFATKLGKLLTRINREDKYAQIFFVDQWSDVQIYADAVKNLPSAVSAQSGNGPCDIFTNAGKERPAGIASDQRIVDAYFHEITEVCAAHKSCFTDHGALQQMPVHPGDLTLDSNHLQVSGLAREAQLAWDALPAAIKDRP